MQQTQMTIEEWDRQTNWKRQKWIKNKFCGWWLAPCLCWCLWKDTVGYSLVLYGILKMATLTPKLFDSANLHIQSACIYFFSASVSLFMCGIRKAHLWSQRKWIREWTWWNILKNSGSLLNIPQRYDYYLSRKYKYLKISNLNRKFFKILRKVKQFLKAS